MMVPVLFTTCQLYVPGPSWRRSGRRRKRRNRRRRSGARRRRRRYASYITRDTGLSVTCTHVYVYNNLKNHMEYDNLLNEISVFISKTVTFYVASNIKLIL